MCRQRPGWGHLSTGRDPGPEGVTGTSGREPAGTRAQGGRWGMTRTSPLASHGDLGKAEPFPVTRGLGSAREGRPDTAVQRGPESAY